MKGNNENHSDKKKSKQEEKQNLNKKRLFLCVLAILILILLVIGVTFSVHSYTDEGVSENVIRTGSIEFKYNEDTNGILITDAMPMSDSEGKVIPASGEYNGNVTTGYFDFNVKATTANGKDITYEIYGVDTSPSSSKLEPQYVKVYLTELVGEKERAVRGFDNSSIPTYSSLPVNENDTSGKTLYKGNFTSSGIKYFRLRLWVSDDYPIIEKGGNETFSMRVNVGVTAL